jgi:endonuclease/exonuclease/phosphatase family metal-dependent hydrolase
VASYNLHQGFTPWGRLNWLELAETLRMLPAALCLQEVDAGRATSAFIDVPLLLETLGYEVAFQPAIAGVYGLAVASLGGVETLSSGTLPPAGGETRAYVKALVDLGGLRVVVANAHLGLTGEERLTQASILLEEALSEPPADVLCGDLNEEPGGPVVSLASSAYEPVPSGATCCLGEDFKGTIDYVMVRRGSGLRVEASGVVYSEASDHLPVYAVLAPPPEGG